MTVERLRPYSVNVFAAMSALAAEVGAVNLGQGFPDEDGPPAMLEAARQAITDGVNQYPPGLGIAPLRRAIAAQRKRLDFIRAMDQRFASTTQQDTQVEAAIANYELAWRMQSAVPELCDLSGESTAIQKLYGIDQAGTTTAA